MKNMEQKNGAIQDVANDVLARGEKYGFQPDEDMVREAVEESANLLNIALTEDQIAQACELVMNPRQEPENHGLPSTHKRYALADQDADFGLLWSVGGVWSAALLGQSPTLLTGPQADEFRLRHPNARIVDVIVYREALQAYNAGFNSVLNHNEVSTPESRMAARAAGIDSMVRAGFSEDALDVINTARSPGVLETEASGIASFNYMLLARLKQDCDYYLGYGNRSTKRLWAGDEAEQIAKMKELYAGFSIKPEWISLDDISRYEAMMLKVGHAHP